MEYNIYEKCKWFDDEDTMECTHPGVRNDRDKICTESECDSFELECPHCKKMITTDDLWREE